MPVRRFWVMNSNINRILAERDLRMLTVVNAGQSADGANECRDNLLSELGDVGRQFNLEPEENAIQKLKSLC